MEKTHTRYYLHLGKRKDINVNYKCTKDIENNDIEERYRISTEGKSEKMSLSITIYHNTGRILIQGTNKKEWINNEFEKLKNVINLAGTIDDINEQYLKVFGLGHEVLMEELDEEICIVAKNIVNQIMKEIEIDDEKFDIQKKKLISPIGKNTKRKIKLKTTDDNKNKINNLQIKNKTASENLEMMVTEMQEIYAQKKDEMKQVVEDSKEKQRIEVMELKKENEKILIHIKEQLIMIKNLEKENKNIKEYHEKEIGKIKRENNYQ